MSENLLEQFGEATTVNNLRPTMHLVKVYSPLISAIATRQSQGLRVQEIQNVTSQIDGLVNSVLSSCKLPIPGQEWLRASIRTALIPLCEQDLKNNGEIQAEFWLKAVCDLTKSLHITSTENSNPSSQAAQVKLALSDATTSLLSATQKFSFLHPQAEFVKKLINQIFQDSKKLCDELGNEFTPDKGNLMTNFVKNHTRLMVSAIDSEQLRTLPTLSEEIIMKHPNGLPLDNLHKLYDSNKRVLASMVPDFNDIIPNKSATTGLRSPSFLNR